MASLEEDTVYLYPSFASAKQAAEKAQEMQPDCPMWLKSQNPIQESEADAQDFIQEPEAGQGFAAAVLTNGVNSLNWHRLDLACSGSLQRIDVSLLKWFVAAAACVFFLGVFLLFLIRNTSSSKRHPWPLPLIAILWSFYARSLAIPAAGTFPAWLLPSKWSDLAGWQSLCHGLKRQMQQIVFSQGSPIISPYYQSIIQSLAWLAVSFLFLSLFFAHSRKAGHTLSLYRIMACLAIMLYFHLAEPDLKPLLYFFPCFMASSYLEIQFQTPITAHLK